MGNFCSGGGKKSPKNERRESVESLPYGQEACSEPPPGGSKDLEKQQQQKSKESLKKRKNNDEKRDEQGEQLTAIQQQQASSKSTMIMPVATASSSITTTANAQIHNDDNIIVDTQLGLVQQQQKSQSSNTSNEILEPHSTTTTAANISAPSPDPGGSLSPIPTASTPSPYSTSRYSSLSCRDGSGGAGGQQQSYQNISPILGHIDLSQYTEPIRASSYVQLFHLRCDIFTDDNYVRDQLGLEDFYLIAISTESDEITVWNIYEQKPTRILKSIPRPRNVHMVDQYRTVVLCNRELMLYDLNHAKLLTKLKGVMNQKMPFYGLHNNKYVVALSRNRMYVNMINLDTGDLETTFKAGEDRFLNSLLTSANGKICVCGDETQKPFPLLVWDLSNRKLLYDLRIPHHEFITKLSAISDDGHYVVSVCQECNTSSTNFLIVYDLQSGTLFKKWKPEHDSVSVAISTQCGGCVINGIKNNDVLVWDISTGNIKYTLSGHTAPPDLLNPAPKSNVFLSYNSSRQDTQLRIWSLENGNCLWIFTPEKEISCCTLTPNGKCIIYGYVGEKKLNLAVNDEDLDKSHDQFLEEMRSKIIPYGDKELDGHEIDLNS